MQKLEKMYCPSCGAPISFEDGRDNTFCSHCGHQIFKEDSQLEEKNRHEETMEKENNSFFKNYFIWMAFMIVVLLIWIMIMK